VRNLAERASDTTNEAELFPSAKSLDPSGIAGPLVKPPRVGHPVRAGSVVGAIDAALRAVSTHRQLQKMQGWGNLSGNDARQNRKGGPAAPSRFEIGTMLRRLAIGVAYFIAIVYVLSIVWPCLYCYQHGWRGPGELDAFMPAFLFTPGGAIATAFSFRNSLQQIRRGQPWSWAFWPLAIIFGMVLVGVVAFVGWIVYVTVVQRLHS
jgi:hypothetical protein